MDNLEYLSKCCMYDMLDEVDRICKKNNLNYFLTGGTLIGAIRHKGYIPWDDDIDIGMLREDYDKFIKICESELDKNYMLISSFNNNKVPNLYIKMKIIGTTYLEESVIESISDSNEIFIDIFPYDNIANSFFLGKVHMKRIELYRRMLGYKCNLKYIETSGVVKKVGNKILKMMSSFYSRDKLIRKIDKLMRKYNKKNTNFIINSVGAYSYEKERVPRNYFKEFTSVPFEKKEFKAMKSYNEYLKNVYGDYMKLPPEEQRTSRHRIKKISIGNYKIKNYL